MEPVQVSETPSKKKPGKESTRYTGPVYIFERPLSVNRQQDRILRKRLDSARKLYNATLGEALKRLDMMRSDKAYKQARALKGEERIEAFKALRKSYQLSKVELEQFSDQLDLKFGVGKKLGSHVRQKLSLRA